MSYKIVLDSCGELPEHLKSDNRPNITFKRFVIVIYFLTITIFYITILMKYLFRN